MKTTTIYGDILKHEGKSAIFPRQFSYFFSKTMQKGRKAQKQSYKVVLGAKRSRNFRKKKEKIASLGKNLRNFLEKYI